MSEGMSEERLAQIDASFPLSDGQWRWDTEDAIEAFGYVRELRDEVRRLRDVERNLRATIADEHSRLSQEFETKVATQTQWGIWWPGMDQPEKVRNETEARAWQKRYCEMAGGTGKPKVMTRTAPIPRDPGPWREFEEGGDA